MTSAEILVDGYGRVREAVHGVVTGLDEAALRYRIDPDANSIAWLIWHLTRVQDDHVADVAGLDQVWLSGWADRFGLPLAPEETGFAHSSDAVGQVVASAELLRGYHDAVHEQTVGYVERLTDADLPRIVDELWDPPVSLGVRLVSVIEDDLMHVGQAAFIRGVVERTGAQS